MKYGGRTKGTPNRITSDLRQFLSQYVQDNIESSLDALEPSKRAELIVKLLPFIISSADKTPTEPQASEPLVIIRTEDCTTCSQLK
jgi:hypothetical protein